LNIRRIIPVKFVKFLLKDNISEGYPALSGKNLWWLYGQPRPWTLPANLAIALHPAFGICAVEALLPGKNEKEVLILARELVENCMKSFSVLRIIQL